MTRFQAYVSRLNRMAVRMIAGTLFAAAVAACSPLAPQRSSTLMSHPLDSQQVGFSTMLVVRDLAASELFYVSHFGFAVTERLESLRRLERPGATLYLVLTSPPSVDKPEVTLTPPASASTPSVNLIFRVKDVRQVHQALASRGLRFMAPPHQPPWGGWRCFAQDPDGYLIEIEQP